MPMISCDPNTLAQNAAAFKELPPQALMEVQTYLLALLAGGSIDPNTLAQQAKAFKSEGQATLNEINTRLLCLIAGGS